MLKFPIGCAKVVVKEDKNISKDRKAAKIRGLPIGIGRDLQLTLFLDLIFKGEFSISTLNNPYIAILEKQSNRDCFVVLLLAMTNETHALS